ncbi:uncharacterized protein J4E84_001690 [Alternaria hordeiaustralica]|uniref:uncharacterized protein n=1 Tax=Alternaria hordeiaustralica TaxID=1187925 RepID=UPI0020C2DD02|nr:uncharacterized protein J4E84_001690 [Alternaria hordeiaustralica]KAI4695066.1 hypothetical protein J4E84_001690 [Alternaria hordeiaustralica]
MDDNTEDTEKMSQNLTPEDMTALEELLRRKTDRVPNGLRAQQTLPLKAILSPSPQQQYFPYEVADVAEGATFAGQLKHRGAIARAMQSFTPMSEWPVQTILAYFTSNVNRHMCFSRYLKQTRVRLLVNLVSLLNKTDTPMMAAYTLACMEYVQHPSLGAHFDPANPTKHQLAFVQMLKDNPDDFIVLSGDARNEYVRAKLTTYLAEARNACPDWAQVPPPTRALFDFCFKGGQDQMNEMAQKVLTKKRKRGKKKTTPSVPQGDVPFVYKRVLPPLFEYDDSRIKKVCAGNALLEGLIEGMPGVRVLGEGDGAKGEEYKEAVEGGEELKVSGVEEPGEGFEKGLDEMVKEGGGAKAMASVDLTSWYDWKNV